MVNKFKARCAICGGEVPALGGNLYKAGGMWKVTHLACADGIAQVDTFNFGGKEYTRNKRGRCEDAPCCGCCTI